MIHESCISGRHRIALIVSMTILTNHVWLLGQSWRRNYRCLEGLGRCNITPKTHHPSSGSERVVTGDVEAFRQNMRGRFLLSHTCTPLPWTSSDRLSPFTEHRHRRHYCSDCAHHTSMTVRNGGLWQPHAGARDEGSARTFCTCSLASTYYYLYEILQSAYNRHTHTHIRIHTACKHGFWLKRTPAWCRQLLEDQMETLSHAALSACWPGTALQDLGRGDVAARTNGSLTRSAAQPADDGVKVRCKQRGGGLTRNL
ncbi:hypothetical protein J3F83DRAFT_724839 [Trichoderma novae-zelandiae]